MHQLHHKTEGEKCILSRGNLIRSKRKWGGKKICINNKLNRKGAVLKELCARSKWKCKGKEQNIEQKSEGMEGILM